MVVVMDDTGQVRLWSRQGKDLTDRFPDVAALATGLPKGMVIDGEVVIWNGDRLEFDLLQQRLVTPPAKAATLRRAHPASCVAFDLLADSGTDLRLRSAAFSASVMLSSSASDGPLRAGTFKWATN
jgi:ATP-dependent DNA ligase